MGISIASDNFFPVAFRSIGLTNLLHRWLRSTHFCLPGEVEDQGSGQVEEHPAKTLIGAAGPRHYQLGIYRAMALAGGQIAAI